MTAAALAAEKRGTARGCSRKTSRRTGEGHEDDDGPAEDCCGCPLASTRQGCVSLPIPPEYEYTDTVPTLPIICPLCVTNRNAFATHDVQLQASLYSFVGSVGIVVAVRAYKH